jgi:hypothetical protein
MGKAPPGEKVGPDRDRLLAEKVGSAVEEVSMEEGGVAKEERERVVEGQAMVPAGMELAGTW